jgi:hypothetical protein
MNRTTYSSFTDPSLVYTDFACGRRGYDSGRPLDMDRP